MAQVQAVCGVAELGYDPPPGRTFLEPTITLPFHKIPGGGGWGLAISNTGLMANNPTIPKISVTVTTLPMPAISTSVPRHINVL